MNSHFNKLNNSIIISKKMGVLLSKFSEQEEMVAKLETDLLMRTNAFPRCKPLIKHLQKETDKCLLRARDVHATDENRAKNYADAIAQLMELNIHARDIHDDAAEAAVQKRFADTAELNRQIASLLKQVASEIKLERDISPRAVALSGNHRDV